MIEPFTIFAAVDTVQAVDTNMISEIAGRFGVRWDLLVAQIINFCIVAVGLYYLAFKPVLSNLDERKRRIDELAEMVEIGDALDRRIGTYSGGMARRVDLAGALVHQPQVVFLDEPTTGLHFEDVRKLLEVLHELVEQGNTVVVIEHNLDVIKTADWLIDIGPEGGDGGGMVVATGTPEDVAKVEASHTGRYLGPILKPKKVAAE